MPKRKTFTDKEKCAHCEDFAVCEQIDRCYFSSKRGLLAAKCSEVLAAAVRASASSKDGVYFSVYFLNKDSFYVWTHPKDGDSARFGSCYLDFDDAEEQLDLMIERLEAYEVANCE